MTSMTSPDTISIRFPVKYGYDLVGIYYLATTEAPLAIFLHGVPGAEKNHDLAQQLRQRGWHALILHFAGCWGSGGTYNPTQQPEDVRTAIDFALGEDAPVPVQTDKIALIGYSLGSRAALMTALEDERIRSVVSISGFGDLRDIDLPPAFYENASAFLTRTTAESLRAHITTLQTGIQPAETLARMPDCPVLIIHGTDDEVIPVHHAESFMQHGNDNTTLIKIAGANHSFAQHRQALIDAVLHYLDVWT